ncbi:uncharacterized protein BXZ73DRAFT_88387 [Epithele typhae]|uniref:uncharacterized protein n=1 Tax=Epithele typhae TaxID=378194 RepID=UPI002007868A|nr:uncharacterized protein BXZ73DRAFT_88387 [Epithele typhae]KAH9941222.1 hypothetical protein BXZ73DRAFT_88387 [Epithele typhae]
MSKPPASPDVPPREKCRLAEIVQYKCDGELTGDVPAVHCVPIPRIFRICPNRPAVELTRYVDINLETGAVQVPSSQMIPKGKPWREVLRRDPRL